MTAAAALALAIAGVAAPGAGAIHHLWKIDEVYLGDGANPNAVFVELRTASVSMNSTMGNEVEIYDANGTLAATAPLTANVVGMTTNRSLLLATTEAQSSLGPISADFQLTVSGMVNRTGGGACYGVADSDRYDCMTWGAYAGPALPSATGTPAPGMPGGCSLDRSGDTDNSIGDFSLTSPMPTNFAGTTGGGPACTGAGDSDGDGVPDGLDQCPAVAGNPATGCPDDDGGGGGGEGGADTIAPDTTITAGPKSKEKKGKATFTFTSSDAGAAFECSLDGGAFEPCTSPRAVKVKKGKHTFAVRARDAAGNVDSTPATQDWKVKKKKKK